MTNTSLATAIAGAFALWAATAGVGHAEMMKVSANLTASAETPPKTSDGSGKLTGTFDTTTMMLTYDAEFKGLSGPATMAHFHAPAPTGKPAPVEIPIKGSVESPIKGEVKLTPEQAKNLTEGMTYFNVHTKDNPAGEIRGQILTMK